MHRFAATVLNDFVTANSASPAYSLDAWNKPLGTFDQLVVAAAIDHADVPGGVVHVYLEHSADGTVWDQKLATTIVSGTIVANDQTRLVGADTSGKPNLAFVRLRVYFVLPTRAARVRLQVSARDGGP